MNHHSNFYYISHFCFVTQKVLCPPFLVSYHTLVF